MKTVLLTLLAVMAAVWLRAQPTNDNCTGARELLLSIPAACPSSGMVTDVFYSTNIGATPAVPYLDAGDCQHGGAGFPVSAAEVWYQFSATANVIDVLISSDLNSVNVALFRGDDCPSAYPEYCTHSDTGKVRLVTQVNEGQHYYLMISGGDEDDQANFTISFTSSRECLPCLISSSLVSFPPPINGEYAAGQTVQHCYTIENWNVTGSVEWPHAVEFDFGSGWNVDSFIYLPPPSCDGNGYWAWYDSWTSCNNGETFGPGFAYESSLGVACGGFPLDNNPGNNWGDGDHQCASINQDRPVTFCVTATVNSCPSGNTGEDLTVAVRVWSDGDSGSWTQTGCNSGVAYVLNPVLFCCDEPLPYVLSTPVSCQGACDGKLTFSGTSTADTTRWDYRVFRSNGYPLHEALDTTGGVTISDLCPGTYSIVVTNIATGCTRSATYTIGSDSTLVAEATLEADFCKDGYLQLTATSHPDTVVNFQWTGPEGYTSSAQNPSDALLEGEYVLTVSAPGCLSGTDTVQVVFEWPALSHSVCENESLLFDSLPQSDCFSYYWIFEGGSPATSILSAPVVTYPEAGSYAVQLMAVNTDGTDTIRRSGNINVLPVPTADFTFYPTLGDDGIIQFEAFEDHPAINYTWSFGDGAQSTIPNPIYFYPDEGIYNVNLVAFSVHCGSDTANAEVIILFPPMVGWQPITSPVCVNTSLQFGNASQGTGLSYFWSFEGGTPATSSLPDPQITYATAGVYGVQLIVSNAAGADTLIQADAVTVLSPPIASFSAHTDGFEVVFENQSNYADSIRWQFGDGVESTAANPVHMYDIEGVYAANLIAFNACGNDTVTGNITILLPPTAGWQLPPQACTDAVVQFNSQAQGADLTYFWSFEGGMPATSNLPDPQITYATAGIYGVQLIVSNAAGADTLIQADAVTVLSPPIASFSAHTDGFEVVFESQSNYADSIRWQFGDGVESTAANPVHMYDIEGVYAANLIAFNACGNDTVTGNITILLPPTAGWQLPPQACTDAVVQFNSQAQGADLTYFWSFEGGTPATSSLPDPQITYATTGVYGVQLIVSNAAGADTLIQADAVTVLGPPIASFSAQTDGFEVVFENISSDATTYHWDFGDGNTATAVSPGHIYAENGLYSVTLTAANDCGSDTAVISVTVDVSLAIPDFDVLNAEGCVPLTVQFFNASIDADSVHWVFQGGEPLMSDEQNPVVVYAEPGLYPVSIFAYNAAGSAAYNQPDVVDARTIPETSFDILQDEATISFINNTLNATGYEWSFGNGSGSTASDPIYTYATSGNYLVQLIATNACGSDTLSKEVNILIVGVEEAGRKIEVNLYPNPNSGRFTLKVEATPAPTATLALYNALGQVVYHEIEDFQRGQIDKTLVLDRLSAGIYWLTMRTKDFNITRKMIVQY